MAYKNDSNIVNSNGPMDFLYSRLATLSALQSYAATAGYYMTNAQQLHAAQGSSVGTFNQHIAAFQDQHQKVNIKMHYWNFIYLNNGFKMTALISLLSVHSK